MNQNATAGNRGETVRSDCFVALEIKSSGGLQLDLNSRVDRMFGNRIREQLHELLDHFHIRHARLEMEDSGALPFVIAARVEAAVRELVPDAPPMLPGSVDTERDEPDPDRIRFSRLYLPGNTPKLMLNAGIHAPDGIILDLEDSVAPGKKREARILVRNALRQVDFMGAERMVRINQLPAGLDDLDEVASHHVELILIPKCEYGDQVKEVEERIGSIREKEGSSHPVYLMPIVESCLGVEHAYQIATASHSIVAMAIGLEDYTADLGVMRTGDGEESLYARTRLVNACKAAGIQPIDSVYSDVDDRKGLIVSVKRSKALGFEGMGCIHPRQVPVIREGFAPGEEEIKRAEEIIEAFRKAESRGLGVVALGTKMIDPPVVRRAQQTLNLARQFGMRQHPEP